MGERQGIFPPAVGFDYIREDDSTPMMSIYIVELLYRARVLERAMFQSIDDSFICEVAKTANEAAELIELGLDYVNEINGGRLYWKKK